MNPYLRSNFVRYFESHAADILRQLVRILFHDTVEIHTVCIIDFHCQGIGNTKLLQVNQSLPKFFLFLHLDGNLSGLALTDSLDFCQALRLFLNDAKGVITKFLHNSGSQCRSHTFYRTGTQITFHAYTVLGGNHLISTDLKLASIYGMFHRFALGRDILPLGQSLADTYAGKLFSFRHQA